MSVYKTYIEIAVYIDYDYQPEESQTQDYPGCDAEVTINSAQIQGQNISLTHNERERIKAEIMDHLKSGD